MKETIKNILSKPVATGIVIGAAALGVVAIVKAVKKSK